MPRRDSFIYPGCYDMFHGFKLLQYLYFSSKSLQKKFENFELSQSGPNDFCEDSYIKSLKIVSVHENSKKISRRLTLSI